MAMKLLTKELERKLPKPYSTEETPTEEKEVIVKYFTPFSNWTWYGVEYDPQTRTFFGLVVGHEKEWGYFSLAEFEHINSQSKIPKIERDLYFTPTKVKDLRN